MSLTVVIACHNEPYEVKATVLSIIETSPANDCGIIVVDDASMTPLAPTLPPDAVVLRNTRRCGVGPSRHKGIMAADTDWVLLCDAHMRFPQGWYERAMAYLAHCGDNELWCGACAAIDDNHPLTSPKTIYYGGVWNMCGLDPNKRGHRQVFEINWNKEKLAAGAEIPAIMGACYFVGRSWYERHAGLQYLRGWGCDEQLLSLKAWLSGGAIRMMPDVVIGHKFWTGRRPFTVAPWHVHYNKAFCMHTLLSPEVARGLLSKLGPGADHARGVARAMEDWHLIEAERGRNRKLLTKDVSEFADRFKLNLK